MKRIFFILLTLASCKDKTPLKINEAVSDTTAQEVTIEDAYEKGNANFDYREFYGIYDHESTTKGFAAILSLKQNGNDLYFTLSVVQGNCKKEAEGVILILPSSEEFPTGFYQDGNCRLQFLFIKDETKVDVKEVTFCGLDGTACSYEGIYKKRIN